MKQLPRTITNPLIGDEVTFLETARETGNRYCLVKVLLQPGGGNGMHYHTTYTEHFEVLSGTLDVQIGDQKSSLRPGDAYLVDKKVVHRFYNEHEEPVVFLCKVVPARQFETMLRIAYGLAVDGKMQAGSGMPKNFFHTAILFHFGESYLPAMPLFLQKMLFGPVAFLGALFGFKKDLEPYYLGHIAPKEEPVTRNTAPAANKVAPVICG